MRPTPTLLSSLALLAAGLLLAAPASAQSWAWALQTRSGQRGTAAPAATVGDAQGNTYVAGTYSDTVRFGPTVLASPDISPLAYERAGAFVTKVSADGQWVWTASIVGGSWAGRLVANPAGGLLVTGSFRGRVTLGALTLNDSISWYPNSASFVAQLSAAGEWEWATVLPENARVYALAADAAGNMLLSGMISDSVTFGTTTLRSPGEGYADAFVAKLRPSGEWAWAVQGGGTGRNPDYVSAVAAGPNGLTYVGGVYTTGAVFGLFTPPSTGDYEGFVAAIDAAGAWQWVKPIPSPGASPVSCLVVTAPSGDLLVSGGMRESASFDGLVLPADSLGGGFVARLDPATRAWRWATAAGSRTSNLYVQDLVPDATGAVAYASGAFGVYNQSGTRGPLPRFTTTFGAYPLTSVGGVDGFVAQLDIPTGQWQNAVSWGSNRDDQSGGLALLPTSGSLVIAGGFTGPSAILGPFTLTTNNDPIFRPIELLIARLELGPLGLSSAAEDGSATLSPNPATATTSLTLAPAAAARPLVVLDAVGRVVRTATIPARQATATIDVHGLPAGLYVVRVGGTARRLVVE